MARILCFDSDTHFSGHPGGQSRFTQDFIECLGDENQVEVYTVMADDIIRRGNTTYHSLVRADEVSRWSQLLFSRRQVQMARRKGDEFDLIVENFIPPVGPSIMPSVTTTPVMGLANFSFWNEMSAKYHLPFARVTRLRMSRYKWVATTHESVTHRVNLLNPYADVRSIGQIVTFNELSWNETPGTSALFLGRPDVHQKGLDLLVQSLHKLGCGAPPVSIAGFEENHPVWRTLIRRWPPASPVEVHGYVKGSEREELMRRARILLLPSRYEGPSYIPLEGAMHGIPTVAFDLACYSDRRDMMYLAQPFDVSSFADEMLQAFEDANLYEEKRRNALNFVMRAQREDARQTFQGFVNDVLNASSHRG